MRILVPACVGLVVVSSIASTMLWRDLQKDEQIISDLRTQLAETKLALAAKPAEKPAEAVPQPGVAVQAASEAPAAPPAKITREAAMAALTEDSVKRQKTLLNDPEYRKALLAQARVDLRQHYAGLAVELGLSNREEEALFDLITGAQVDAMNAMGSMADGAPANAAVAAELRRQMEQQQQKLKDSVTALLGPERTKQFEEYDEIQPSRTRVSNLTNLLGRSGQALTDAQKRSLTAVMVAEQRRMEAEAKAIKDAGQTDKRVPADIQAETNRRLLEKVPSFLNPQQVQLLRGRFEERANIDRASDRVQQREREVLGESPN